MFIRLPPFQEPLGAPSCPPKSHSSNLVWLAALSVVLLNAATVFLVARPSGLATSRTPGLVLLGLGGLQLLAVSAFLERDRSWLWQSVTLSGAITQRLAGRRTLWVAAVAAVAALPSAIYALCAHSTAAEGLPGLVYGAASILTLAFYHGALWLERVHPNQAISPRAHLARTLKLTVLATFLASGLLSEAELVGFLPLFGFAAAFVATRWHGAVARIPCLASPNAPRPAELTATYALVTIVVTRGVQALLLHFWLRRGMPAWQATTLAFVLGGGVMLAASLLWQRQRGVSALTEQLGLAGGRGLAVVLREALLWSVAAVAIGLGYWGAAGHRVAATVGATSTGAPMITLLAGSVVATVAVTCVAAPLLEELLYRGMLYRSLRSAWGAVASLLISAGVFALDHSWLAALPVLAMGACATLAFERSRSLYAAMLVHALYNGVVVLMQLVG